jgi:hypothetical protein
MIGMRVSFLLVLVSFVAHADVAPPPSGKSSHAVEPPPLLEYSKSTDGAITATPKNVLETPYRFQLDARAVTVGFEKDFKIHVRVAGGGELVLDPAGQGYMSRTGGNVSAQLSKAAPVPLVEIASRPEACSDYWEVYVSVVDGVPREALRLDGLADPPSMSTPTVKFARDGAVVTTRTSEDDEGKKIRTTRTRYRFDGRVYVDLSKRAGTNSK